MKDKKNATGSSSEFVSFAPPCYVSTNSSPIGESDVHHTIHSLIRTGGSVRNRWRVFNLAMVAEREPLERRPAGCRHFDSVRHRPNLPAVALRPGLCRVRRLVHRVIDPLGMAGRSRGAGSIRCDRGDGVPGGRGGDDVLAEVKEGIEGEAGLAVPPARATRGIRRPSLDARTQEPARPPREENGRERNRYHSSRQQRQPREDLEKDPSMRITSGLT